MFADLIFLALVGASAACHALGQDGCAALAFALACFWGLAQEDGQTER